MLVEQLGNKNQFKVFFGNGVAFQSYDSLIAFKNGDGKVFFSDKWAYSKTTLKQLKLFLRIDLSKKEIEKKIKNGDYIIVSENDLKKIIDK